MSRRTGLFIAWLLATLAGVLIATAAVGSVRNNVADRPTSVIVPIETIEALAGSTTLPTTDSTASATSGTTSGTTGSEASPTPTPLSPVTSTTAHTTQPPGGGEIQTVTGQGGSMSVEVHSDHLVFLGAVPTSGFTIKEQHVDDKEIVVKFESSGHETKLEAKLEDDGFQQKVDEEDE